MIRSQQPKSFVRCPFRLSLTTAAASCSAECVDLTPRTLSCVCHCGIVGRHRHRESQRATPGRRNALDLETNAAAPTQRQRVFARTTRGALQRWCKVVNTRFAERGIGGGKRSVQFRESSVLERPNQLHKGAVRAPAGARKKFPQRRTVDSVVRSARPNELRNDNDSDNGSDNGSDNDELQVSTLVWRILRRRKKENSKRSLMTPSTILCARCCCLSWCGCGCGVGGVRGSCAVVRSLCVAALFLWRTVAPRAGVSSAGLPTYTYLPTHLQWVSRHVGCQPTTYNG